MNSGIHFTTNLLSNMFSLNLFIPGMPKKSPTGLRSGARDTSAIKPKVGMSSQWCRRLMFSNAGTVSHFFVTVMSEAYENHV